MSNEIIFKSFREATQTEMLYAFNQSHQITMQTSRIGCLRGDFGKGEEFYTTWTDDNSEIKTSDFKKEFDDVINTLRYRPNNNILGSFDNMERACHSSPSCQIPFRTPTEQFCFRADTDNYSYIIRCLPHKGDYNFYITAYKKDSLDYHMQRAERGIQFISSKYDNLFKIEDGDHIQITYADGEKSERSCRYIDDSHIEVGNQLFHICQFAEIMEKNGNKVIPFRRSLPDECFVYVESEATIGIVKKGEMGYFATKYGSNNPTADKGLVKRFNERKGVKPNQAEAMKAGSMFGWETPAADPKNYDEFGTPVKPKHRDRGDVR